MKNNGRKFQVKIRSGADNRKKLGLWLTFGVSLICVVSMFCGVWMVGDYFLHRPLNADTPEGTSQEETSKAETVETPSELRQKQVNILIAGIDAGDARSTNLTDTLMVANIDMVNDKISILQIPRDTYVDNAVWTGKINAVYNVGNRDVYGRGINGLMNCISDKFKIHLDYYVLVNLEGFRDLVDAMGGVKISFDEAFTLKVDGKVWEFKEGEQVLSGKQAEVFVRERNSRGGDLGRVQRGQRVLVAAMIKQLKSMNKGKLLGMIPTLMEYVKTDVSITDALSLASTALAMDTSEISFDMVPGEGVYINGQSCYTVHLEPLVKVLNEKFRANMDPIKSGDLGLIEVRNTTNYYDNNGSTVDDVTGE
ncbi:MAG: LCP family protein [Oscillospiraceae bacterium]|nr:LCP family protein [Oscillospiraceae bacterium]